ncbi:MAG: SDR family NAD(P)-dependent oxidoreductase [Anaerolineae bacterium]|nr:SDR family NAD(P)-dependent oxidoreductase [Anaerolineae bacterium]
MDITGQRVLVTGAGGFVGSHLVERLVTRGAHVRCFIRYNSENRYGMLQQLPDAVQDALDIVAGDLRDEAAVREAMEGVSTVFHLGALIAIPYSYQHPRDVIETNVMGTLNVLMAAKDLGGVRVVHTSTSEVYGTAQYVPIDEAHPLQAQSPYAASKIAADKVVESFSRSFELPCVTIRPFNIFGPRQSARAVIPTIITQALTQSEIRLGATSPTRDFTYVGNTVEAYIRAAENDAALGGVFNIGSNFEVSIGELAQTIVRLTGRGVTIVSQEEERMRPAASEVRRLWAANAHARDVLGWQPHISFEAGLQRTIDWIAAHLDHYRPGYTI